MLGKSPRIMPIFFEDPRITIVGKVGIWFEAYGIKIEQLFQYCGKAERGSGGHKTFPVVVEILAEVSVSSRRTKRILSQFTGVPL